MSLTAMMFLSFILLLVVNVLALALMGLTGDDDE